MNQYIYILLLSVIGFINAYFLHYQYKRYVTTGKKMYCPIGGECQAVVTSKYGRTLGIKNEFIGMSYYSLIFLYSLLSFFSVETAIMLHWIALDIIILATLFSIYLFSLQIFIIKQLCSWCLFAILINLGLFFLLLSR